MLLNIFHQSIYFYLLNTFLLTRLEQNQLTPAQQAQMKALSLEREYYRRKRDAEADNTSEAYKTNQYRVTQASQKLGEAAAEAYVLNRDPAAQKLYPQPGDQTAAGVFDQVWRLSDGKLIVIEAKGGSSPTGTREIRSNASSKNLGKIAEQGSTEYLYEIIASMRNKGGNARNIAVLIEKAIRDGKFEYGLVRQKIDGNSLAPIEYQKFIIKKPE